MTEQGHEVDEAARAALSLLERLVLYTDGSGLTGGPAGVGFAAYDITEALVLEGSLCLEDATNQKAELIAAAFALESIPRGPEIELLADSEYVCKNWNERLSGWRERGWRKSKRGMVMNQTLWERLILATECHRSVSFTWTRGHVGTAGNERAHQLAFEARLRAEEKWKTHRGG